MILSIMFLISACELRVKVRYCQQEVIDRKVTNPVGCRLYHGQPVDAQIELFHKEVSTIQSFQISFLFQEWEWDSR